MNDIFNGRDKEDIPTIQEVQEYARSLIAANTAKAEEQVRISAITSKPDFQEVVNIHFAQMVKDDPELLAQVQSLPTASARLTLAYRLGKAAPAYVAKTPGLGKPPERKSSEVHPHVTPANFSTMPQDEFRKFEAQRELKAAARRRGE